MEKNNDPFIQKSKYNQITKWSVFTLALALIGVVSCTSNQGSEEKTEPIVESADKALRDQANSLFGSITTVEDEKIPANKIALGQKLFFETKLSKDGTGVGLCMSKTIVEEHCKGHLHVKNDEEGAVSGNFAAAFPP